MRYRNSPSHRWRGDACPGRGPLAAAGDGPGPGLRFLDGAIGIHVPADGYVYVVDTSRGLLIFPEL